MALQKTIVLTALPDRLSLNGKNMEGITTVKSPSRVSILIDSKRKDMCASDDVSPSPVRKRQRLDHLTHEEKIQRRKLKNRVAAQCARDRKKEKMNNLEDEIQILRAEKDILLEENIALQRKNLQLEEENNELKKRLQIQTTENKELSIQVDRVPIKQEKDNCGSLEHAAETGSSTLYSLDDALSLFADDTQSDNLLDLLEQCSKELLREANISSPIGRGDTKCNSEEKSDDQMVGPTSEELESVKELIEFDHIYYKHKEASLSNQQEISTENKKQEPTSLLLEKVICEGDQQNTEHSSTDFNLFQIPSIVIKQECEELPEPVSPLGSVDSFSSHTSSPFGDSGYDTSSPFSAGSPFSDHGSLIDDPWSETFTELFPSLA